MNIEEKVKMNLMVRGFDSNTQLNNRGLIGATIDETILEVVKNFGIGDVSQQRELFKCDKVCDWYSVGHQFNGHQECRTCCKQKEF